MCPQAAVYTFSSLYQLMYYRSRQSFDAGSAGGDSGAASTSLGKAHH
jgi:hypothetical protein